MERGEQKQISIHEMSITQLIATKGALLDKQNETGIALDWSINRIDHELRYRYTELRTFIDQFEQLSPEEKDNFDQDRLVHHLAMRSLPFGPPELSSQSNFCGEEYSSAVSA